MEKYLLSIIIPTKNREYYCIKTLEHIIKVIGNRSDIQVLIQDNSTSSILSDYMENLRNDYLKYFHIQESISFVDNFHLAVDNSEGEYIMMLGDDDGILPYIFDILKAASNSDIDAIIPDLGAVYFWPSQKDIIKKSHKGLLIHSKNPIKVKLVETRNGIKKLLSKAGQSYQQFDLARLYHGIIKRNVLKRNSNNKFFGGLTPDIYGSISASLNAKKSIRISLPITISGICDKSGSSDSATGKHTGNLKDAPHFRGHSEYKWVESIPKFYSVETIWAETALKALKDFNEVKYFESFNHEYLKYLLYYKYPEYRDFLGKINRYGKIKYSLKSLYAKTLGRILSKVFRFNKVHKYNEILDINYCKDVINNNYKSKDIIKVIKKIEGIKP